MFVFVYVTAVTDCYIYAVFFAFEIPYYGTS